MANPTNSQYLESKVYTASQPQLQLMLLDGALRFGRQAKDLWESGADVAEVDQQLARMADIVDELTYAAAQGSTEISRQLEEQYAFIYRELAACRINRDAEKLSACLKLIEYQRETWKLACEKIESENSTSGPGMPHIQMDTTLQSSPGFSLEA